MGYWYSYKIKSLKENFSIPEKLISANIGMRTDNGFTIDISKLSQEIYSEITKDGSTNPYITINENGNAISYYHKWVPDDRLADAISKAIPEEIFLVTRHGDYGDYAAWYIKNGIVCDAKGKSVVKNQAGQYLGLFNINTKLKTKRDGSISLSLPIGSEDSKWVFIDIPKESVIQETYTTVEGIVQQLSVSIMLTQETYKVSTKQSEYELSTVDIVNKYIQSKDDYRKSMHELLKIDRSKILRLDNRGDYYIVYLPCLTSVSSNGRLSITIPNYDVKEDCIVLGERGSGRNVIIAEEDGMKTKKRLNHPDIIKYVDEAYSIMHPNMQVEQATEQEEER